MIDLDVYTKYQDNKPAMSALMALDNAALNLNTALKQVRADATEALERIANGQRAAWGNTILHTNRVVEVETANARVEALVNVLITLGVDEADITATVKGA